MRLVAAAGGTGAFEPFDEMRMFTKGEYTDEPNVLQKGDCLVVWGGADISPSLYNKPVGRFTGADNTPSKRDSWEWAMMNRALELNIPIIGVCRGAQMLCALAGGFLIQDVTDHGRSHSVSTDDGNEFTVNSLHHQMMYPFHVSHEILAWSTNKRSKHYLDVDTPIDVSTEPECVWFSDVNGMAIQWHPEFMDSHCVATKWIEKRLQEKFNETQNSAI